MCEELQPNGETKPTRLRTFRSGSELPYLVLPDSPVEAVDRCIDGDPLDEHGS